MNMMPNRVTPLWVDLIGVGLALVALESVWWAADGGSRSQLLLWCGYGPVLAFALWKRWRSTRFWSQHTELADLIDKVSVAARTLPVGVILRTQSSDGQLVALRRRGDLPGHVLLTRMWASDADAFHDDVDTLGRGIVAVDEILAGRMVLIRRAVFDAVPAGVGEFVGLPPQASVWRRLRIHIWHLTTGAMFAREAELRELLAQIGTVRPAPERPRG